MVEILGYELSFLNIVGLTLVAALVGMAKTGIAGAGMIAVPILALMFGGKASTGLLLPFLIMADVMAVKHYHRDANWGHLRKLLPFAVIGIVLGTGLGNLVDNETFTVFMAGIVLASLGLMIWQERQANLSVSSSPMFVSIIGILGGVTTMVGNLAGPVMALYLLAMRFPKKEFIGTAAWFFLTVNVIKVPFHVFVWQTVSINSVSLNLMFLPAVILGAWTGIKVISMVSEKLFRIFILVMTAIAAVAMLI